MSASRVDLTSLAVAALDAAPFGVALFDRDLRFTYANDRLAEINGRAVTEHLGRRLTELTDHPNAAVIESIIASVFATGEPQLDEDFSNRLEREKAPDRYFVGSYYPIPSEGGDVAAVVALVVDVSNVRQAELERTRTFFSGILASTTDPLFVKDLAGRYVVANEACAVALSTPDAAALIGARDRDIVAPEVADWIEANDAEVFRRGVDIEFEDVLDTPEGQRTYLTRKTPLRDSTGAVVGLLGMAKEITDRKRIEAELRRSEERYRSIVQATSSIVWVSDPNGNVVEPLPGWEEFTGQPFVVYRERGWVEAIHPDDRHLVEGAMSETRDGRPLYQTQYRLWSREHGGYRHVVVRGTPRRDVDGTMLEWTGVCLDITEQIETEAALRRRRANTAGLAQLAASLAAARSVADVIDVVPIDLADALDSLTVTIGLLDASRQTLDMHFSRQVSDEVRARYEHIELTGEPRHVAAAVVSDGEPRWFESLEALAAAFPDVAGDAAEAGVVASACLPVANITGDVIGAVTVGWGTPTPFDAGIRETLTTAVRVIGESLERARLHEAEHRFAKQFQQILVAPLRLPPQYEVAARYVPAASEMQMGGDWYDAVPLPNGRTAIVVGDVTGHGADAAADMAMLKAMMSTLLALDLPIDMTMARASSLSTQAGRMDVVASALVIVLDPERGELLHLSAGHPPFIVVPPGETARLVESPRRPLIGVPTNRRVEPGVVPFPPGALLVAFTDGLVEHRHRSLDETIRSLAEHIAANASLPCEQLLDVVIDAAQPSRDDDLAVTIIRAASGTGIHAATSGRAAS